MMSLTSSIYGSSTRRDPETVKRVKCGRILEHFHFER